MTFSGLQLRSARILSGFLILFAMLLPVGRAENKEASIVRVHVSADGKQLVVGKSGQRFVPWGFNYLGEFGRLAEDDWDSPAGWRRIESDFQQMRKLGANIVRWHLQFETFMKSPNRADQHQLARLKRLLRLARDSGLYLDLTGLNCFR